MLQRLLAIVAEPVAVVAVVAAAVLAAVAPVVTEAAAEAAAAGENNPNHSPNISIHKIVWPHTCQTFAPGPGLIPGPFSCLKLVKIYNI